MSYCPPQDLQGNCTIGAAIYVRRRLDEACQPAQASIFESRRRHQTARSKATGPSCDDLVGTAPGPDVSADDRQVEQCEQVTTFTTQKRFNEGVKQAKLAAQRVTAIGS